MPLFRCIYFFGERWWALRLFLDIFIFFGEGVDFMPLFRCIFLYIFFLKVWLMPLFRFIHLLFYVFFFLKVYHFFIKYFYFCFFFFFFWGGGWVGLNASF